MKYEMLASVLIEFESDDDLTDEQAEERATNELEWRAVRHPFEFEGLYNSDSKTWVKVRRS